MQIKNHEDQVRYETEAGVRIARFEKFASNGKLRSAFATGFFGKIEIEFRDGVPTVIRKTETDLLERKAVR